MTQNSVDLAGLFGSVTQALAENQHNLNQADEYNSDHGDNMVRTFETITGALEKKKGSSASTALSYAAKQLSKSTSSGSGKLYAQNLNQAAAQMKGKSLDQRGALDLLQTLIGASGAQSQAPTQGGGNDMLGALLGGMAGGQGTTQGGQASAQGGMEDLLGALLGGGQSTAQGGQGQSQPAASQGGAGDLLGALLGGGQSQAPAQGGGQSGLDLQDLLSGAMAFMQAKQSGGNTMTALVQGFMAASGMGSTADRQQSTQIVVNAFLQALSQGAK
ncbi:dihydroxyacetone kinase subunit L [bacterium]|nr:MAG: dihydroxyacetone kinase subunit L [bacterium]